AAGGRVDAKRYAEWLAHLGSVNRGKRAESEAAMRTDQVPIHPLRLCKEVRDFLDRDAILVVDGQEILNYGRQAIPTYVAGHRLNSGPFGTMGVGLPYGLGAKVAKPEAQVLVLHGDGSFGLNAMELDTAARHHLPVITVISLNGGWTADPERNKPGRDLGYTRFDRMAEALGCYGEHVEEPDGIRPALERAAEAGVPAVVNVVTDWRARATTVQFADYSTYQRTARAALCPSSPLGSPVFLSARRPLPARAEVYPSVRHQWSRRCRITFVSRATLQSAQETATGLVGDLRGGESSVRPIVVALICALAAATSGPVVYGQQTSDETARLRTRDQLTQLLDTVGPDIGVSFRQSEKQPYNFIGSMQGLANADSLEIVISVTTSNTIAFRIYPHYKGGYINVNNVSDRAGFMKQLLRMSDRNFLFWGADDAYDVFAGYTVTLESGFPNEAMKVVLRSIRNLVQFVGDMKPTIGR